MHGLFYWFLKFIALGPVVFDLAVLQTFSVMRDTVLASIPFFLFAGELMQLYMNFARRKGWKLPEVIEAVESGSVITGASNGSTEKRNTVAVPVKLRGEVIGVIPRSMVDRELAHPDATEMRIVTTLHERKAVMAELSDAFIALPGGFGTFEEFFEVWTWRQLGYHDKPIVLLNVNNYFAPLLAMIETPAGIYAAREIAGVPDVVARLKKRSY